MARGRKRTVAEVCEQFRSLVGKKGVPIVRVAQLDERAMRWHVLSIDEEKGLAKVVSPDGARGMVAHVFDLVLAPVAARGEGSAANRPKPVAFIPSVEREANAKAGEAAKKAEADAAILARRK